MNILLYFAVTLLLISGCSSTSSDSDSGYTFGRWTLTGAGKGVKPRGGNSKGPPTTQAKVHQGWADLVKSAGNPVEKDRAAILAMQGSFRASFEFLETLGFKEDYKSDRPYRSWGTEYVFAIESKPNFISLQHILVMSFESEGKITGPIVIKHWRQDWLYQQQQFHRYLGDGIYQKSSYSKPEVQGYWLQKVYQVDDSPRYQVRGKWTHKAGLSSWQSDITQRPLPRREYSVRSDYNVLEGTHKIIIHRRGWLHEQSNYKYDTKSKAYIAREAGLNRYEAITDFDISAGTSYWQRTASFWQEVRKVWADIFARNPKFKFQAQLKDKKLFEVLFKYAETAHQKNLGQHRDFANNAIRAHISKDFSGKPATQY